MLVRTKRYKYSPYLETLVCGAVDNAGLYGYVDGQSDRTMMDGTLSGFGESEMKDYGKI